MGNLWATVGSSHSGKSTFAKKWKRELSNTPRVVVTTDNIRLALHGRIYNRDAESVVFAHKNIMIKTLLLEGYAVLTCGTNSTRESLKRILEIDANTEFIIFDTPEEECIRRTELTGQKHMIPVIKRHCKQIRDLLDYGFEKTLDEIRNELEYRWKKP